MSGASHREESFDGPFRRIDTAAVNPVHAGAARAVMEQRRRSDVRIGQQRKWAAHSITSSARARNDSEMARPSALVVLRLTVSSNHALIDREFARTRAVDRRMRGRL